MADGELIRDDERETRQAAFLQQLGIPNELYTRVLANSLQHAVSTAVPDPVGTPWRSWGARNVGGRVRALVQHPRNFDVLYAGSAHGGVFETRNAGDTWTPLGEPQDAFPVGAIALAPSNPDVMYVGSGEPLLAKSTGLITQVTPAGDGLFRRDAAAGGRFVRERKAFSGLTIGDPIDGSADSYARIVVDPNNADRCWVASSHGLWRREIVGGATSYVHEAPTILAPAGSMGSAVSDVALVETGDPAKPYRLYAAIQGIGIHRGHFTGGATAWDPQLEKGLPDPSTASTIKIWRIRLAVCQTQPAHVYAAIEGADGGLIGLFHSRNNGDTWQKRSVPEDLLGGVSSRNAWWALALEVHPDNAAIVVLGTMNMLLSRDFGRTWARIIDWQGFNVGDRSQHADQHVVLMDRANSHNMWVTNDGGIAVATDVLQENPYTTRGWRRRSDGLQAAQFNDITLHPRFPSIMGGGLQDNGAYVGYGGRTWYFVTSGDGGEVAFDNGQVTRFIAANQDRLDVALTFSGNTAPGGYRASMNPDQGRPRDEYLSFPDATGDGTIPANLTKLFIPLVEKHPLTPGHVIAARTGDAVVSSDFGMSYTRMNVPMDPSEEVSALAYGGPAATSADWWIGVDTGHIWRGTNASPPSVWERKTPLALSPPASPPAPVYGSERVSRIIVHPANPSYVLYATAASQRTVQGRVFLSLDRGDHWVELTGAASVGPVPPSPGGPGPTNATSLPPCPVTSLAFDPGISAAMPQSVFAGTMVGVYVIRNLPPATAAVMPAFHPSWNTFNGPAAAPPPGIGRLPLTLVKDLVTVQLPANGNPAAEPVESVPRSRLYAALFGRGIFATDITDVTLASPPYPQGGPTHRLFIRQQLIEDGLTYPRASAAVMNAPPIGASGPLLPNLGGDPRYQTGVVPFDDVSAWDIRVDNAPFQFFEQVVDGVEFDTELVPKNLAAGELNIVYVQVQTAGWGETSGVQVYLFFAEVPAASPMPGTPQPPLQADFWATFRAMPLSPPSAPWTPVAPAASVTVHPNDPVVVRFDWLVPRDLGGKQVGLLALCEHPGLDPLPAGPVNLATVIRNERRAAYRRVAVTRFTPDVYVRDSVEDDGTVGAVAFGGRSPDIIVVPARVGDPGAAFADLLDGRAGDRVNAGPAPNFVYVRVHNRRAVEVRARVDLFFVKPANPALALFNPANWTAVAAISPPGAVELTVPARGSALAEVEWTAAPAPDVPAGVMPSLGLIAFVHTVPDALDPLPLAAQVSDVASFWQFFRTRKDSNNAAFRTVLYR
jgi:hypothetical protein